MRIFDRKKSKIGGKKMSDVIFGILAAIVVILTRG